MEDRLNDEPFCSDDEEFSGSNVGDYDSDEEGTQGGVSHRCFSETFLLADFNCYRAPPLSARLPTWAAAPAAWV